MNRSFVIVSLISLFVSCKAAQETTTSTATTSTTVTQASATTAAPAVTTTTVTTTQVNAPAPAPAAAPAGTSLASQETNWPGVRADVIEFKRKGNTVTAKVRLTNTRAEKTEPDFLWKEVSLIDTAGGKKYEVLKDEKNNYLASTRAGWSDRWNDWIDGNSSQIVWMKFPAPPPEVKTITLQMPKMPPFDDLTIQD